MKKQTKILSALGAALTLGAAIVATELPTWVRVVGLLPALALTALLVLRWWQWRVRQLTQPPRPLDAVTRAEKAANKRS
jgi:hypothetical protein